MSNICRTNTWSKKTEILYLQAGPVEATTKAESTDYDVEFVQDWKNVYNNYSGGRIESGGCVTTWNESANNTLTEWEYTDTANDPVLRLKLDALLSELNSKKSQLISSQKTSPFNLQTKINSKIKPGTRYMTLPITVWCTVSDFVEYSFRGPEASIIKTPEYPEPKEEWAKASPREGTTGHLGNKHNARVYARGCLADTDGGTTTGARVKSRTQLTHSISRQKDVTIFLSLKLSYTKLTAV